MRSIWVFLAVCLTVVTAWSDTLTFKSGNELQGTILQTNGGEYVVLIDHAIYNFAQSSFKAVKKQPLTTTARQGDGRLPDLRDTLLSLGRQPWCSDLTQVPATVIDRGIFRNVPYVSFRCGEDHEVNVYGDLNDPAGIELGIWGAQVKDAGVKQACLRFVTDLLNNPVDKEILRSFNLEEDSKLRDGYTFQITPPSADDAYGGWWVSVYSEAKLDRSRASDEEMEQITVARVESPKSGSAWAATEAKISQTPKPDTIAVVTSSGEVIPSAEVVRVVDNAYVVWRSPTGGLGMTRLEGLPEDIRTRLGYDASRAATAYAAEEKRKTAGRQASVPPVQVATAPSYPQEIPLSPKSYARYSSASGGSVYVKGYFRKDGTYVRPHTRNSPGRR